MKLDTFFEKFDLFADAPDAVGKMRELVFQLAVQGRLVQQDRTEESATVLLKRIRAARAELPTNRRSIDETHTMELEEESAPFIAPSGWKWTSLGNVQVFTNGYAFKSEDYQSSGVGIIRMGELGANGEIDERNMKYVANDIAQSLPETFRVRPGDLLMGMSGSIGKLAINRSDKTYLLNQRVGRLEPIIIEKSFLHVFLKTVEQHYLRISFGMAIKNLSTKQINETPFPLPPLAEQKRIVAKVDELMALCDRLEAQQQERASRERALARASLYRFADAPTPANFNLLFHSSFSIPPSELRNSILTLAVQGKLVRQDRNDEPAEVLLHRVDAEREQLIRSKKIRRQDFLGPVAADAIPFDIPTSWQWRYLADVCVLITDGAHHTPQYLESGVPFLSVKDVSSGTINFSSTRYISEEAHRELCKRCAPEKGDILLTKVGTTGIAVNIDENREFSIFVSLALLKFSQLNLDSRYMKHLINSPFVKQQSADNTQGIGNKNLVLRLINQFTVPIPPLAEQRRIVAKVEQLMALVDALEQQLAASRATAEKLLSALVAQLTA